MKKILLVCVLLVSMFFLQGFSFIDTDPLDRSPTLRFDPQKYFGIDTVYVCLSKGNAYHNYNFCDTEQQLLGLSNKDFQIITEYEAILRGFFECPDCSSRAEYSDVSMLDDIESTVDDIDENLCGFLDLIYEQ